MWNMRIVDAIYVVTSLTHTGKHPASNASPALRNAADVVSAYSPTNPTCPTSKRIWHHGAQCSNANQCAPRALPFHYQAFAPQVLMRLLLLLLLLRGPYSVRMPDLARRRMWNKRGTITMHAPTTIIQMPRACHVGRLDMEMGLGPAAFCCTTGVSVGITTGGWFRVRSSVSWPATLALPSPRSLRLYSVPALAAATQSLTSLRLSAIR
mmetsp:Transcript_34414/g.76453  ORF Transcript_34414/g.76453 Transcript_34414/m.76453 type:complete len:209 (-) Transcript_34414:1881-2507(-)